MHRGKHRISFLLAFFQDHARALARTVLLSPRHTWALLSTPLWSSWLPPSLLSLSRAERTAQAGAPSQLPGLPPCQQGRARFVFQGGGVGPEQLQPGGACLAPAAQLHLSQQLWLSRPCCQGGGAARTPSPALPGPGAARPGRPCTAAPAETRGDSSCQPWHRGWRCMVALSREKGYILGLSSPQKCLHWVLPCCPLCPCCCRCHAPPFPLWVAQDFGIYSSTCAPRMKWSCQQPLTKEGCWVPCGGRCPVATIWYQMTNLKLLNHEWDTRITSRTSLQWKPQV